MKKFVSLVMVFLMAAALFTGCTAKTEDAAATETTTEATAEATQAPAEEATEEPEATTVPESEAIVLKFGNASAPDKLGSVCMENFCELVTERTNGALICEWYPSEQLGSSTAQIEAMMSDNQAGNCTGIDVYGTYNNALNVLAVPFAFESGEHIQAWLASDYGQAVIEDLAETANLRLITANMVRTPREIISTTPVYTPDDLEGKAARVANVPMQFKFFSYWGCSTNQISWAEYPMALMQGVVNCGETSCESFSTSKFHLYAPYISMVDFAYPLDCIMMSNDIFMSLTEEQQQIIYDAAAEVCDYYNSKCLSDWEAYIPTMIEEGAQFIEVDRQVWIDDMENFKQQLIDEEFFDDANIFDTVEACRPSAAN